MGEPLLSHIRPIVEALVEVVPPLLDRPFVFFGHSMGVLVAFDLIRALREQGLRQPELLIASGRNAPQFRWRDAGLEALPDDEFLAAAFPGPAQAPGAELRLLALVAPDRETVAGECAGLGTAARRLQRNDSAQLCSYLYSKPRLYQGTDQSGAASIAFS